MGPAIGQANRAADTGAISKVRRCFFAAISMWLVLHPTPSIAAGVTVQQRTLVDASRSTPSNGSYPGDSSRTLRTLIWTPEDACTANDRCQPYPLLLMAHGMSGLPESFDAFARNISENGYIVAAPTFPLTNADAPGGSQGGFPDTAQQPDDLVFLASQLAAATADPEDDLFGRIETGDISALGVSLGGATVEALAHTDCCNNIELDAAILAGTYTGILQMFGGQLHASGPTTMVLHGTADALIPFSTVPGLLEVLPVPRFLVGIKDAEHDDYIDSQTEPPTPERAAAELATLSFLDWKVRGQQAPFDDALGYLSEAGHTVVAERCLATSGECAPVCTGVAWSEIPGSPPDQRPSRAMLKLKNLNRPGQAKLAAKGFFNPAADSGNLDPAADGIHLRLGINGQPVYDVNIPATPSCSSRDGWISKSTGTRAIWKYRNRSAAVGPLCAEDSAKGLATVVVKDLRSTSRAAFRYKVKVKKTTLAEVAANGLTEVELALAFSAQADLGVPSAAALAGRCALDLTNGDPIPGSRPKPFCASSSADGLLVSVLCKGL